MTQEEIIRMARDAGLSIRGHYDENGSTPQELERFATLVAANEAKEHLKMLENLREETKAHCLQGMAESYEMGKEDEREACAKLVEEMIASVMIKPMPLRDIVAAIRQRGEK